MGEGWALVCLKGDTLPRVLDTDLAERLEMPRTRDIRTLIIRHLDALAEIAPLEQRETVSRYEIRPGISHSQKVSAYYLTEEQAAYIAAKSDMPKATAITIAMVKVFVAWGKGELPHQQPRGSSTFPPMPSNSSR